MNPSFEDVFKMNKTEYEELIKKQIKKEGFRTAYELKLSKKALKPYTKQIKDDMGYDIIQDIEVFYVIESTGLSVSSIRISFYPNNEKECEQAQKQNTFPRMTIYKTCYYTSTRPVFNNTTVGPLLYYLSDNEKLNNTQAINDLYELIAELSKTDVIKAKAKPKPRAIKAKKELPNMANFIS